MSYPLEPEKSPEEPYDIETKDKIDPSLVSVAGEEWRLLYDAAGRVTTAVIFTEGRESGRLAFHYDAAFHISQVEKTGTFSEKTLFLVLDAVYANAVALLALPNPYPVLVGNWPVDYPDAAVLAQLIAGVPVTNFPATYDVSDRAARLLGVIYGNLGQVAQVNVGGVLALRQDIRGVSGQLQSAADWTPLFQTLNVAQSTKARLQPWYQANFVTSYQQYAVGSTAPHAATQRWSYTVPVNRIAIVTNVFNEIMRDAAPTTAATARSTISIVGGSTISECKEINAGVGLALRGQHGWATVLRAGDVLQAITADLSTGGTYQYTASATLMVFDT